MKWKRLFDSPAALRILPDVGDRRVYAFPIMQFSASFFFFCWRLPDQLYASNAPDEEKVLGHISLNIKGGLNHPCIIQSIARHHTPYPQGIRLSFLPTPFLPAAVCESAQLHRYKKSLGGGGGGATKKESEKTVYWIPFQGQDKSQNLVGSSEEDPTKVPKKFQQGCQEEQNQLN